MATLRSERLLYRAIEESDDPFLLQFHQDPDTFVNYTPFLPGPQGKKMATEDRETYASCMLAAIVCLPPSESSKEPIPIGVVSMKDPNPPFGRHTRLGKFGIMILRDYQGKGYGTEAVKWALDWGFKHAALHKISTMVYEHNPPSIKMCEKLGFKLDGRLRDETYYDGRFWDDLIYSMLEHEWRERYCDNTIKMNGINGHIDTPHS